MAHKKNKKAQKGRVITGDPQYDNLLNKRDSVIQASGPNAYRVWDQFLKNGIQKIKNERTKNLEKGRFDIIEDNKGQLKHPGKVTKINSPKITMKGVNYPVLGVSDIGDVKLMQPNGEYSFNGDSVTEFPLAKTGIHIKPENKGKFNALKKRTGKTTEELTHSKNPLTRKRAIFAQNAKKWKKGQYGGQFPENPNMLNQPLIETDWGSENIFAPGQFSVQGQAQQFNNTLPQQGGGQGGGGMMGGMMQGANIAGKLIQGFRQIKQDKENRKIAKQSYKVSKLVNKASSLPVDRPNRKYTRPEDNLVQPGELYSPYGEETNYLKHGGNIPKAQWGQIANGMGASGQIGNTAGSIGSFIGGGSGQQSGASQVGGTVGGAIGSIWGPVGEMIGTGIGSLAGGIIGGKGQRQLKRYQEGAENNLTSAAFNKQMRNQYVSFMKDGGVMGGELQMYNGDAELMSQNPYLPDNGETVIFRGASHKNGGIDMKFGKSSVEVEGGEPAVKLENGGEAGLTVFGNMKIPSYGITELQDKNAKGKKFKNYIKELSEKEAKQNRIVDKSSSAIDENPLASPYDKLKMSSNEAMLIGANMNLKEIARKKEVASGIQNAILETADELGLESDSLAKGKIKKAKMGMKIAQDGKRISRSEVENYLKQGWVENPDNPNQLMLISKTPGKTSTINIGDYKPGSEEFQKAFAQARKAKLNEFDFKGKKYNTDLYTGRTKTISSPGSEKRDYLDIYDPENAQSNEITPITPGLTPSFLRGSQEQPKQKGKFDALGIANTLLPYLRPTNQLPLDPNQLSGEMYALATNQLEPVQAQLYQPLLEQVSDISLQDQMNANQADFNSMQRQLTNNPAALASLAAQKYAANSGVLGEQFRLNQGQKQGVYNRNRGVLNDATLKNLSILDQQYVRQSTAKSNTKATAQAALSSIADKIAKNKLENRTLGIYENLYNYRFGPKGHAWNLNGVADFQIPSDLSTLPTYVDELVPEGKEAEFNSRGQLKDIGTKAKPKKTFGNGSIVKSLKSY